MVVRSTLTSALAPLLIQNRRDLPIDKQEQELCSRIPPGKTNVALFSKRLFIDLIIANGHYLIPDELNGNQKFRNQQQCPQRISTLRAHLKRISQVTLEQELNSEIVPCVDL